MLTRTARVAIVFGLSIALSLCVTLNVINAQIDFDMETVNRFGGYIGNASVQGDYAFINQGTYLTVLDISGPQPQQVAYFELPEEPLALYISGVYIYTLLTNDEGFYVINISDPLNPAIEGTCDLQEEVGQFSGIHVIGNYAYVAAGSEGLKIVDVSDPSTPNVVGTLVRNFIDVFVLGDYAYAIEFIPVWNSTLWVINITDPENPVEEGSVDTESSRSLHVVGDYAFIAENWNSWGMRVVDVSDPENPTSEAFFQTQDGQDKKPAAYIDVEGDYAYLACSGSIWLFIADISNPLNPTEAGKLEIETTSNRSLPTAIQVEYPNVYMAIGEMGEGFQVIDVTTSSSPSVDKTFESPSTVTWQLTDGDYLYVASVERLWVYDIRTTPEHPTLIRSYTQWQELKRIIIQGDILYGLGMDRLYLIDISDPNTLTEISSFQPVGGFAYGLEVLGDYAYLLAGFGPYLLEIVDVLDPSNPEQAGEFELLGTGKDIDVYVVEGNFLTNIAYFNDETDRGFQIVDVTDPSSPFSLGSAQTVGWPTCIWKTEDYVYVGSISMSDEWWLEIFDPSILPTPTQIAQTGGAGQIWDVEVIEGVALCGVMGASLIAEWYDAVTGYIFTLETCPSPGTTQSTATYPNQSNQGYTYSTEGGRDYHNETGSIAGSNGVVVQMYIKPPPSEEMCCISTSVAPDRAGEMGCLANPGCAESECETPIPLVASPQEDWVFLEWTGAATGFEENTQSVFRGVVPPGCVGDPPKCTGWIAVANFTPWLRLGGSTEPFICPVTENEEEINILPFTLTASNADDWEVEAVTVAVSGDADVLQYAKETRLTWTGGEQTKPFPGGGGSIQYQTSGLEIPKGSSSELSFHLTFQKMEDLECPFEPKEFTVNITFGQVEAETKTYKPGEVQGSAGGDVIVGCVWNIIKEEAYELIQEAVEYASSGDTIAVCPGTYEENVSIDKSLTLRSTEGYQVTDIIAEDANTHVVEAADNEIIIKGFTIKGATGTDKAGIYMHGSTVENGTISKNYITGNKRGIYLHSAQGTKIKENIVSNNTDVGILLESSTESEIVNNTFRDNGDDGLRMENCQETAGNSTLITNSTFRDNDKSGMYLKTCRGFSITDNISISDNKLHGIFIESSDHIGVTMNPIIKNNSENGIHILNCQITVGQTPITIHTNTIEGSKSAGKQKNGIYVENSRGISIGIDAGKNTIINHQKNGISFLNCQSGGTEETKIKISGNEIKWNDENGIHIESSCGVIISGDNTIGPDNGNGIAMSQCECGSSPNEVKGASIKSNTYDGVYLGSSYGNHIGDKTDRNTIEGNRENGIYLSLCDCTVEQENLIRGNIIKDNEHSGIFLEESDVNRITDDNQIGPNGEHGIHLRLQSDINTIEENIINGNMTQKDGIFFEECGHNTVEKNEIQANAENGIHLKDSGLSGNIFRIMGNTIKDNTNGIFLEASCSAWIGIWENGGSPLYDENTIGPNTEAGIKMEDCTCTASSGSYIAYNIIKDNPDGISVKNATGTRISKNTVGPNNNNGISLYQCKATQDKKNEITGNTIQNNTNHGIYLEDSYGVDIGTESDKNTVQSNKGNGIHLKQCISPYADHATSIVHNTVGPENKHGIYLEESDDNEIKNNDVQKNKKDGIHLKRSDENVIVENKPVQDNKWNGIYLKWSEYNEISGNEVLENDQSGIYLYEAHSNRITGIEKNKSKAKNIIERNGDHGIRLDSAHRNSFNDNDIKYNDKHGIALSYCRSNYLSGKMNIMFNEKDGINMDGSVNNTLWGKFTKTGKSFKVGIRIYKNGSQGMHLRYSPNNDLKNIKIWRHSTGLYLEHSNFVTFDNVFIEMNWIGTWDECSGKSKYGVCVYGYNLIQIEKSGCSVYPSEIVGCTFYGAEENGIICETGGFPTIHKCNIYNNAGFALDNLTPDLTIDARGNWWGDPSGPGGNGPGTGDAISGDVDFSNWLVAPVSLIVFAGADTVFISPGEVDSVSCHFVNWEHLFDVLDVIIDSDSTEWLFEPTDFTIALHDSAGNDTTIYCTVPFDAQPGSSTKIRVIATSQSDPALTDVDSFYVIAYDQSLAWIDIIPDTVLLRPDGIQQFFAQGYDSTGIPMDMIVSWTAGGGTIDSTGLFTAGDETGIFQVTAEEPVSFLMDSALVEILPELVRIEVTPDTIEISPLETVQFTAHGYDSLDTEIVFDPIWSAGGGTIDSAGFYTAGGDTGVFTVIVTDRISDLDGQAFVTISAPMELGDVNCDGNISPGDALCCFWRAILGDFQEECFCVSSAEASDVNCDGAITPGDALCIFWRAIFGDWTEECQCQPMVKIRPNKNISEVRIVSASGKPGNSVTVSMVVKRLDNFDAFGLQLTYPANLLEFQAISPTPLTKDWIVLDGAVKAPGVVNIGGFHTEGFTSDEAIAIAEVTFSIKDNIQGNGEFDLTNLVDDLTGAAVVKGSFTTKLVPKKFALHQNYPNPFNPNTDIRYQIPDNRYPTHTSLKIYNILGQEIKALVDEEKEPGYYTVTWDGKDSNGIDVASGIYFYRLEAGKYSNTKRMLLIK